MSAGSADGEPMSEMNTTPLIDVMLVLLIMFIITIPVATHAVNIDARASAAERAQAPSTREEQGRADPG
jgi:biopolymer transport protein ExbD